MNKVETYNRKNILSQIKWLIKMVRYLLGKESSEGGNIQSIQEGANIIIDDTDPQNPIISSTGGNLTLEQARQNGNVLEGDVEFLEGSIIMSSGAIIAENETFSLLHTDSVTGHETGFNITSDEQITVTSDNPIFLGLVGAREFDKQGDRRAFAQIADVEDAIDAIPISAPEFVKITEGSNTGWGLKYRVDNPNNYGNIGSNAVDLSISVVSSSTIGATGNFATVSGGSGNTASGDFSTISGGTSNIAPANTSTVSGGLSNFASGDFSTISGGKNNTASSQYSTVSGGDNNTASGLRSTVSGGDNNTASGLRSTVSGGLHNTANSFGEWVGGVWGTIPTGQNPTSWVATNRLFNVGNGTANNNRSNAFTILKNGLATLPSVTNALIDAEPTGKAVVTKEWVDDFYTTIPGYDAGETQTLKHVNGVLQWVTD